MAILDIQKKIGTLVEEGKTIAAKADLADADLTRLEEIAAEGEGLKKQVDALKRAGEFTDWANKSAGMIPLAGNSPADVLGTREAGGVTLDLKRDKTGAVKSAFVNEFGEMILDEKTFKAISEPEYARSFRTYMRVGLNGLKSDALKVLQEGSDIAGGFLAPADEIWNRLIAREPAPQTIAARVTRMQTSRDRLVIPKVVYTTDNLYTSGMRVTWTGEVPASATTHRVTEPSFGQEAISIYTAMMSLPLTNDMIEDAAYPIVNWCTGKFGETRDLLYENMIINGSGGTQPEGIVPNANMISADVHTGAASTLTWDGIVSLLYALPEQYDRNAVVVMNKTNCAQALAKLVDGNGRPYWTEGLNDSGLVGQRINRPLMGYPVIFNAFMPNVSAGLYPIFFGDMTGYYLVDRVGFSIQVLRELYAETNQVLLLGRLRFGGKLVEDHRIRGQVVSA